jgi:3-carboxy-cis,cis-muconate cycloisomerase
LSSADESFADVGLLSPVRVGTAVEAATGDRAFLQAMLDAECALVRAQAEVGVGVGVGADGVGGVPSWAAEEISAAARAERLDVRKIALRARAGGNPVIPLVDDLAAAVSARAAPYVHRGATSQDIVDTALMLVAARSLAVLGDDLRETAEALERLAARHRGTPMAGRTLTQHAVPTTFGLKAAGWRALVLDAAERLAAVRLPAQLGGAAGTLAAFGAVNPDPVNSDPDTGGEGCVGHPPLTPLTPLTLVDAFAAELGLAAPDLPWHCLRTPIADLGSALAFAVGALGKFAADVLLLSRTEIGEVAENLGGGSSAMPHKANPVRATLIASAARQAPALAAILLGSLTAEDERPAGAWHAEWQPLRDLLRLAGGAAYTAAALADGLQVFPERMAANLRLTRGLVVSERLVAVLRDLVGPGEAKALMGRVTQRCAAEGVPLDRDPELSALIPADRLVELVDPVGYLGSAAELVDRALTRALIPTSGTGTK